VKIVLAESIRKNELCPITSDPITESSSVTRCGHVFSKDGIEKWLQSPQSKGLCPLCKHHILF
jgi:SUMO ligase MMS21 Smc5/6 complex component